MYIKRCYVAKVTFHLLIRPKWPSVWYVFATLRVHVQHLVVWSLYAKWYQYVFWFLAIWARGIPSLILKTLQICSTFKKSLRWYGRQLSFFSQMSHIFDWATRPLVISYCHIDHLYGAWRCDFKTVRVGRTYNFFLWAHFFFKTLHNWYFWQRFLSNVGKLKLILTKLRTSMPLKSKINWT